MTVSVEHDADDRLEEAALLLEAMAQELRSLKKGKKGKTAKERAAPVPSEAKPLETGARVRVTRQRDQYTGRTGVVMDRRGKLYWYVRLDATEHRVSSVIFKKDASLGVIEG